MKNQYFADERDYLKYSIIRYMTAQGLTCTVCWMMTPNDESGQGDKKGYLEEPGKWAHASRFETMNTTGDRRGLRIVRYEYKIVEAKSQADIERKMNELEQAGYRLASLLVPWEGRLLAKNPWKAVMERQLG